MSPAETVTGMMSFAGGSRRVEQPWTEGQDRYVRVKGRNLDIGRTDAPRLERENGKQAIIHEGTMHRIHERVANVN